MNKKIKALITVIVLIIFSFSFFGVKIIEKNISPLTIDELIVVNSNVVKDPKAIGLVGDSWVANKKLDTLLFKSDYEVSSFGQPGATSKQILENLLSKDMQNEFNSSSILSSNVSQCVVIAGVNDFAAQFGAKFYSENILNICKVLKKNNIQPIVLSLPVFDIVEYERELPLKRKLVFNLYSFYTSFLNSQEKNYVEYRELMEAKVKEFDSSILIIDYSEFCADYINCKDLYKDSAHLNELGYEKLSDFILSKL